MDILDIILAASWKANASRIGWSGSTEGVPSLRDLFFHCWPTPDLRPGLMNGVASRLERVFRRNLLLVIQSGSEFMSRGEKARNRGRLLKGKGI